jgi:phosphoserine phosphatase
VRSLGVTAALVLAWATSAHLQSVADPLPSCNDGAAKRAIVDFVTAVTTDGGPDFVAAAERIAVFDNDGTLWSEKPLPTEIYFLLGRVEELARADPSLRTRQPFQAALERDPAYFHEHGTQAVAELLLATHTGMTQAQFRALAHAFLTTGRHPTLGKPFTELVYQPMLELVAYLRAHDFTVWISSGGTTDFMRAFAPRVYGVPPEHTIGTEVEREARRDGDRLEIFRLPHVEHFNDKDGKPIGIDRQIGMRPLLVAGNVLSGGDVAMMEYSRGRSSRSLQLLVNHDDSLREFAYAERDGASLAAARRFGFTVVSIEDDWRAIYPRD